MKRPKINEKEAWVGPFLKTDWPLIEGFNIDGHNIDSIWFIILLKWNLTNSAGTQCDQIWLFLKRLGD